MSTDTQKFAFQDCNCLAIRQAARGIVASTPQELPVFQATPASAEPPPVSGIPLPVVQSGA